MQNKLFLFLLIPASFLFAGHSNIHHTLSVRLQPGDHFFEATDEITIPAEQVTDDMQFLLLSDLQIESLSEGVKIKLLEKSLRGSDAGMDQEEFESDAVRQHKYALLFQNPPQGDVTITLKYSGRVNFPIENSAEEYARSFSQTPGIIDERGAYLAGATDWIPWFNDKLITFDLTVNLPQGWDVVSQGARTRHDIDNGRRITTWSSPEPMEEVFLIAAPFTEYSRQAGAVQVMAFLRTPDENLANKYLETTAQYLDMYRKLIGPYPFSKFALVENFWETGYGMPSFTLLGEQVIRFPFILHSSYPHELLHNYWGNSVYVDFKTGNWCEGMTAYLADHLIAEQRGQGDEYRRNTLQKFTDYVNPSNDFPVNTFISRTSAASEAIGYGKCLMMWDMLREQVGDETFVSSLQKFYRDNKFKVASFDDIRHAFEAQSGLNLQSYFQQWTSRTGAPELSLSNVSAEQNDSGWGLAFTLAQKAKAPFDLRIPVAVSFADSVAIHSVPLNTKEQSYEMQFADHPRLVQVDPQFHVFRKLHYSEIPPALSKIFGADKVLILLPSKADVQQMRIYQHLADNWSSEKIEIRRDDEIDELPVDKSVWLFGLENKFSGIIKNGLRDYGATLNSDAFIVNKTSFAAKERSFIAAVRHPKNKSAVAVLLTTDNAQAVPGLARKLPHYGKYSYLVFEGDEPTNIAKGQWPIVNSPLVAELPRLTQEPAAYAADLPTRQALAKPAPVFSAERMQEHVDFLASEKLQGRGLGSPGLERAAAYIVEQFQKAGLQPGGENGTFFQTWQEKVNANGDMGEVRNIIGVLPGKKKEFEGQSVVVCAHYDHLGLGWPDVRTGNEGKVHYGADDNASGVAVLIELAASLAKGGAPDRTIIFAAFSGEESGLLGSRHYVKTMQRYPVDKIMGVLNLDTVGRLHSKKLLVLNSSSAREWKFIFMGVGYVTGVEADLVTQELDASDQVSFIEAGVPAVQLFSGANMDYHRPTDTADKIDADGMVKVATFARETIDYLVEREEPMTFAGSTAKAAPEHPRGGRSVSTGSMPDFAFSGEGVKLASISPDSPADKAGLLAGDVIIRVGDRPVKNLRDYSEALKQFKPGDEAAIVLLRDGEEKTVRIVFQAR